jgi:hypothetical protein
MTMMIDLMLVILGVSILLRVWNQDDGGGYEYLIF